jgi:hypothetical protein
MPVNATKTDKSLSDPRLLTERALPQDGDERIDCLPKRKRARSVTVNL